MSSNMLIPAKCEYCKKDFIAKTTKTRFCTLDCARDAYKERQRNEKIAQAITTTDKQPTVRLVLPHAELKDKELLTIKETCQLLSITNVTLRRWIKSKRILSSRLGKKHLIKRSHIDELI
jgi:excisionase family DNA binding protein